MSRARMFEECPRRFYHHYYFSKAGYAPDAPEEAKLALEMKSIKGLDMWVGEVVHQTIQWVLEQAHEGTIASEQEARSDVRRRLSDGWRASKQQLWRINPDDVCPNLFEHYYSLEVGSAVTDRLKTKALVSAANFMASEVFESITHTPGDRWLPIDKFASFRLDGVLMYVKFDFALRGDDQLTVYDWKTGAPTPDEDRQLTLYAMYTSDRWHIPIQNVKVCAAHLQPTLELNERFADEIDLDKTRSYLKQSFQTMVKHLRNPARNIAAMDDFPMTGNLLRCVRCNFKGICEQGKQASGDVDDLPVIDWRE